MELSNHSFEHLFAQLGLPSEQKDIDYFIKTHSPLPHTLILADAPFWTASQAAFLREGILNDSDWAEVIDQLNAVLHADNHPTF